MAKVPLRTIILDIYEPKTSPHRKEDRLAELGKLIGTLGGVVIEKIIQKRGRPSAKTFLGTGKIREVAEFARARKIDLIIVNGILKPNQYLHLRHLFPGKHLWDRTDLILNIFDKHANSRLAQLQIKLARLHHEIPKLYARASTTLFERAGAGIGTRGPGEKGIEDEKRHIRNQIKQVEQKIERLHGVQAGQRQQRRRTGMPTVALVGYTNVGKSSLMQILTRKKGIAAKDQLFTTLDTRIGTTWLHDIRQEVLVSDTIGFISDLPPKLISSFLTTLQEAQKADLLLHVIDISDPLYRQKTAVVQDILLQLGSHKIPQIYVCNKKDRGLDFDFEAFALEYQAFSPVLVSCLTGEGIEDLKTRLSELFAPHYAPEEGVIEWAGA